MAGKIPWLRVLLEGAVIVGSILLALSLEAWWAEREVSREVSADLVGIDVELEANLDVLAFELDLLKRTVAASASMLESLGELPDAPFVTLSDTIAAMARLSSPTLDVSVGGVDALLASGRLPALRSPELRRRLAGLSSKIEDLTEDEYLGREVGWQQLNPAVYRSADLDVGYVVTALFTERVPGLPLQGRSMISHPNSFEIRGALRTRMGWYGSAIREAEKLVVEMSELRALIRADLNTRG